VLEARGFAEAYRQVQAYRTQDGAEKPGGAMVEAVMECEAQAVAEARERRGL